MAFDQLKPAVTDNYSTQFTQGIRANLLALALMLDSVQSSFTGTVPTYAKRWNRATGILEEYSGTAWAALPIGSVTTTGTVTGGTFTSSGTGGTGGTYLLKNAAGNATGGTLSVDATNNVNLMTNTASTYLVLGTNSVAKLFLDSAGVLVPANNGTQNLGSSGNRFKDVYATSYTTSSFIYFSAGSGGYLVSNDANWGFVYRPSTDGVNGSHVFTNAAGAALASISSIGGGKLSTPVLEATYVLAVPGITNQTTFFAGSGDGATYSTHNTRMHLHWGLAIEDYAGNICGVYDARAGSWDVKGAFKFNGLDIASPGVGCTMYNRILMYRGSVYYNTTTRTQAVNMEVYATAATEIYFYLYPPGVGQTRAGNITMNAPGYCVLTILVPAGAGYYYDCNVFGAAASGVRCILQ